MTPYSSFCTHVVSALFQNNSFSQAISRTFASKSRGTTWSVPLAASASTVRNKRRLQNGSDLNHTHNNHRNQRPSSAFRKKPRCVLKRYVATFWDCCSLGEPVCLKKNVIDSKARLFCLLSIVICVEFCSGWAWPSWPLSSSLGSTSSRLDSKNVPQRRRRQRSCSRGMFLRCAEWPQRHGHVISRIGEKECLAVRAHPKSRQTLQSRPSSKLQRHRRSLLPSKSLRLSFTS